MPRFWPPAEEYWRLRRVARIARWCGIALAIVILVAAPVSFFLEYWKPPPEFINW